MSDEEEEEEYADEAQYLSRNHSFTVHVHQEAPDDFWAEVEELPGCFAAAKSLDELWDALTDAVGLYLGETIEAGKVLITNIERVDDEHPDDDPHDDFRIAVTA